MKTVLFGVFGTSGGEMFELSTFWCEFTGKKGEEGFNDFESVMDFFSLRLEKPGREKKERISREIGVETSLSSLTYLHRFPLLSSLPPLTLRKILYRW